MKNTSRLKNQLHELDKKLERLLERYILEEISQEMFVKFQEKYKQEMAEIQRRLQQSSLQVSNPEECVEQIMNYAKSLPEMWDTVGYKAKNRLQKILFPQGIWYNKKINKCRTSEIEKPFVWIAVKSQSYTQKKIGIPELNLKYTNLVDPFGVELHYKIISNPV